jgi:heme-degrading monooxygenase HmoA
MFIAMNQFQVDPERASDFEDVWKSRETYLQGLDGFLEFALLRGDEPGDYVSHSVWASRDAFLAWTQSESFRMAHSNRLPDGILVGHPRARFYDSVLVERGDRGGAQG